MSKSTKIIAALGVVAGIGVAALPLSTFAAANTSVTFTVNIDDQLSLSADSGQSVLATTMTANQVNNDTLKSSLKVSTNNPKGYKLTVADADADTALVHTTSPTVKIPALSATGDLASGTAGWGIQVNEAYPGTAVSTTQWTPMVKNNETAIVVRNSGALSSAVSNQETIVKYGVATAAGQASGSYSDTISYTATVND